MNNKIIANETKSRGLLDSIKKFLEVLSNKINSKATDELSNLKKVESMIGDDYKSNKPKAKKAIQEIDSDLVSALYHVLDDELKNDPELAILAINRVDYKKTFLLTLEYGNDNKRFASGIWVPTRHRWLDKLFKEFGSDVKNDINVAKIALSLCDPFYVHNLFREFGSDINDNYELGEIAIDKADPLMIVKVFHEFGDALKNDTRTAKHALDKVDSESRDALIQEFGHTQKAYYLAFGVK